MTKDLDKMNHNQERVFDLLSIGMNNLISTKEIQDITNLDERYVRLIISELILEFGVPIGSFRDIEPHGFFIITNEQERNLGTRSINQQIKTMQRRKTAVANADLNKAILYREKNKGSEMERDIQLDIFYSPQRIRLSPKLKRLLLKANSL